MKRSLQFGEVTFFILSISQFLYFSLLLSGYYCLARTRHPKQHPCPAGSYSNLTNLHKWTDCTECPKGQYCLEGAAAPSGICPTGHYCPPGKLYVDFVYFHRKDMCCHDTLNLDPVPFYLPCQSFPPLFFFF